MNLTSGLWPLTSDRYVHASPDRFRGVRRVQPAHESGGGATFVIDSRGVEGEVLRLAFLAGGKRIVRVDAPVGRVRVVL